MLQCCILITSGPRTCLSGEAKFRSIKHDLFLKGALLKMSYSLVHTPTGVSLRKRLVFWSWYGQSLFWTWENCQTWCWPLNVLDFSPTKMNHPVSPAESLIGSQLAEKNPITVTLDYIWDRANASASRAAMERLVRCRPECPTMVTNGIVPHHMPGWTHP